MLKTLIGLCALTLAANLAMADNPKVLLKTSLGDMVLELDAERAPISTQNFLRYADAGHYDGLIFHRVIPGFMIQGGGFTPDMRQREVGAPIKNEADNGLTNDTYTLAMARTNVVDSATSQFFINHGNNDFLNHGGRDFGYAVFGKVVEGQHVVETIAKVPTANQGMHQNVPTTPVTIISAERLESAAETSAQ
ncbi:MAG: peptidylprolyl isomerase A [Gammaproteobacteria bacterium HGW-Gammaproteobacteria-6]|nr:MAG: peptidylprolyl isomerase A [Gammaproteobacteria bacterium HGW-Gammaproteobacteria-6]